jgi:hypothetical protein
MRLADLKARLRRFFVPADSAALPQYVREYREHFDRLLRSVPAKEAMELAVGGEFHVASRSSWCNAGCAIP